jgi:hypothetical protein
MAYEAGGGIKMARKRYKPEEIIGRRMARDDFEARRTDHPDKIAGQARDGPDEKDE